MAKETALWQRIRNAKQDLILLGHRLMFTRIENLVDDGTPDVEGCLDGTLLWIELKSEMRPKRPDTPVRFKVRQSQSDWFRERVAAGCCHCWILAQVGEAHHAALYLIPGSHYDDLIAPESRLAELSMVGYNAKIKDVLLVAAKGW